MILSFLGCASTDLPPGVSFRVSGPVDSTVIVEGAATQGVIAWAWLDGGDLCARADAVPFDPQVWRYAMLVDGPPDVTTPDVCVPAPTGLADVGLVAWGLPVLVVGDPAATVQVDPRGLLDWLGGRADLEGAIGASDGRVAAVASDHLLMVTVDPVAWPDEWCRFDTAVQGLTLYVDDDDPCGGWEPLAAPGTRTEFQGVGLGPLPQ